MSKERAQAKASALTVITTIRDGQAASLRNVLREANAHPERFFARIVVVHFARWSIFCDDRYLLFASSFDGTFDDYIDAFLAESRPGLERIWAHCVGYDRGFDANGFKQYIRDNALVNDCFFSAYPDLSVLDILDGKRWRICGERLLPSLQRFLRDPAAAQDAELRQAIAQYFAMVSAPLGGTPS